jgi:Concanavalin A-like lectin/glucanases superfamily/Secretion system C-terminal sorting domain
MPLLNFRLALIAVLLCLKPAFSQIPTMGLVGYYPFNGTTLDSSLAGNHALASGGNYSMDRFGTSNAAFTLNGISDSIVLPIPEFAPITGDFSISFWLKTSSPDKMNVFSSKQFPDDTTNNFELQFTSNTIQQTVLELQYSSFTYWNGTGSNYLNNLSEGSHGSYYNGQWHHYVLQRSNDTLQIWFDKGVQYPSSITYYGGTLGDAVNLIIGAGSNRLKGTIDDIACYTRNLSPTEIGQLFHDHKPFVFLSPKPTDAYAQGDTASINWTYEPIAVGDSVLLDFRINGGAWTPSSQNNLVDWTPYTFPMNYPIGTEVEFRITDIQNPQNTAQTGTFRVSEYKWERILDTLPFTNRDGVGLLNFAGKMWLIGGWDPPHHAANNYTTSEVWNSTDGVNWTFVNEAPWQGRHCSGWLVHDSAMWVIGGDPQSQALRDVWKSTDGINWIQVLDTIPGLTPLRTMHNVASLNGKILNFGGQQVQYVNENLNQVWESTDGSDWTRLPDAPWTGRGMMLNSCVDDNGNMWLLGGGRLWDRRCYNDVWKTADGINWELITASAPWKPRYWHNVAWFDNKLWVMNGMASQTDNNETWYSENGTDWYELKNPKQMIRHAASTTVYDHALWMMAGINSNDVWRLQNQLTLGVSNLETEELVSIYPNPFSDEAVFQINATDYTNLQLTITDAQGKLLRTIAVQQHQVIVEKGVLKSGVYFYQLNDKQTTIATGRFVTVDSCTNDFIR